MRCAIFDVGFGLVFFRQSLDEKIAARQSLDEKIAARQFDSDEESEGERTRLLPPSISGIFGFKTENDTWGAGGVLIAVDL